MAVEGIAEARAAIGDRAKATFDDVHAGFIERLSSIQADDEKFLRDAEEAVKTIGGSLEDECVQTSFNVGGKLVKKISKIGDRVAAFNLIIEQEEAKLADLWKKWDDVQDEYRELGIDVFGREAFGIDIPGHDKGFFKEMKLLGLEHETRVDELDEEIEGIGMDIMKKIKASEKVWNITWSLINANICRNGLLLRRRIMRSFSSPSFCLEINCDPSITVTISFAHRAMKDIHCMYGRMWGTKL